MSTTGTAAPSPTRYIVKPRPLILYAESNRVLLHFVSDVLELSGYRIEHFPGGVITRAAIQWNKTYALILLDNDLSDIDGLDLIRYARQHEHHRQTPIILTSYDDHATEARLAGANDFIQKPHNLLHLAAAITRLAPI